jgi:hypothetical protein
VILLQFFRALSVQNGIVPTLLVEGSDMQTENQREAQRRYRERHRETLNEKARIRNASRSKEYTREANRKWRERHPEEVKRRNAEWREANNAKHRADARRWQIENPERFRENQQRWKSENPKYSQQYYQSTEQRRMTINLRACLRSALLGCQSGQRRARPWRSDSKIGQLVACAKAALIAHIEAQFQPGMSWENYGRGGWEIDYIIPCAAFDLIEPAQQRACFHYTNLRPLWRIDNLRRPKGRA